MAMSKFKVGDKVVVLKSFGLLISQKKLVGETTHIVGLNLPLYKTTNCSTGFMEYELEFADVYNSPLYQALKEEE